MKKTKTIIFFGRLEWEKWFDLVMDTIIELEKQNKIQNYRFFIFGSWSQQKLLEKIKYSHYYYDFQHALSDIFYETSSEKTFRQNQINKLCEKWWVYFFGWQNKNIINHFLSLADASLMPSRFLETFWLSALESWVYWVPVIGYRKWGLREFVLPELDINSQDWNEVKKIIKCIENLEGDNFQIDIEKFSKSAWLENIEKLNMWKYILLVSDFTQKIGWIENFLHHSNDILEKNWYETKIVGYDWEVKSKALSLIKSGLNIKWFFLLDQTIYKFSPTSIWYHSMLRYFWWLGFLPWKTKKFFMMHDLGYLVAYPSKLTEEKDIPEIFSFKNFVNIKPKPHQIPLLWLKYISLKLLHSQIQKTTILVPSQFMKDKLDLIFPKTRTLVLPHFFD